MGDVILGASEGSKILHFIQYDIYSRT